MDVFFHAGSGIVFLSIYHHKISLFSGNYSAYASISPAESLTIDSIFSELNNYKKSKERGGGFLPRTIFFSIPRRGKGCMNRTWFFRAPGPFWAYFFKRLLGRIIPKNCKRPLAGYARHRTCSCSILPQLSGNAADSVKGRSRRVSPFRIFAYRNFDDQKNTS